MQRIIAIMLIFAAIALAGSDTGYQFISPLPGSNFNTRESTIIIREGMVIDESSIAPGVIDVAGSQSGKILGRVFLSSDKKTIIFKPDHLFAPNETVEVTINGKIRTVLGKRLPAYQFSFRIAPFAKTPNPYEYIEELRPSYHSRPISLRKAAIDSLPTDFPPITTHIYDSTAIADGFIFLAVASEVEGVGYHLMMLNNDGTPFFHKRLSHDYAYDFKVQPNGLLTYGQFVEHHSYTGGGDVIHMVMDNTFTVIDSFQMGNGYIAEGHDFQMLPNGHVLLFGYYLTRVDMSRYVQGGYPNALVSGGVVQELDADKNVVFQWRTWDYYDFADFSWGARANAPIVSAFHLNTINLDIDGHLFLATPEWVKKINRQTGEIIYHLGGDENQFSFIGVDSAEAVGHFGGHAFHRIANGHVLLYDNGNRPGTRTSQVVEYILNEEKKTAEFVWKYVPDPKVYGWHRGNAQRLLNGNTMIGWGGSSGKPGPACTEVSPAGEKVFELFFDPPSIESYRAFRFPFPNGATGAEVTITEVAPGNTYNFIAGDSIDTGVSVKINTMKGDGYNELTVKKFNFAPLYPQFAGKAPFVIPRRMMLSNFAISEIDADIRFQVEKWEMAKPESTVVYHREFEGRGLFVPLVTMYNPVTKTLVANTNKFGEFILTTPDLKSIVFTPRAYEPADSGTVNQTLPVTLRWNPIGYVNYYALQVARDSDFANLIVDEKYLAEAFYKLESVAEDATYFWRVKAFNDAGESEWSKSQLFTTIAPFVKVTIPNGGEQWQRGLEYFVQWNDNLAEKVVLELYKGGALVGIIDTTESTGAYRWEIVANMATGNDYSIRAKSLTDEALMDMSDNAFTIMDTTSTKVDDRAKAVKAFALYHNYPNPFNPATSIVFDLPKAEFVTLKVYDVLGHEVKILVQGVRSAGSHSVIFEVDDLPSGIYLYRLETPSFSQTHKMILMK